MTAIKIENLTRDYKVGFGGFKKVRALDNLNLEIFPGEIFGFLGPNGSGKTTTIKLILGLIKPTKGKITVLGKNPSDTAIKRRIGYLPESPYFYDYLTAYEFLSFCAEVLNAKENKIDELLQLVDMKEARDVQLKNFSRGMLQRIGVAQALLGDPELIILDEPMGGLDPIGRKEVRDIIVNLRKEGKTIFFSSHILSDAEMICDRVGILVKGKLLKVGRTAQILSEEIESIEITAKNISQNQEEELSRISSRILKSDNKVMFIVSTPEERDKVIKYIIATGGEIISVVPRRKTLEEYFMSFVR
jgi:ABC-2 type transport system ATP-binding protein|uniref:ABC transporter ATP-binding protein n=1 Tax=candidate division WOR-3 bacterium TaxID=2052148 RepID=A0A7C3UX36_UNCW3